MGKTPGPKAEFLFESTEGGASTALGRNAKSIRWRMPHSANVRSLAKIDGESLDQVWANIFAGWHVYLDT